MSEAPSTSAAPTQPNVLFIITDQHRFDHVGFAGNPVVRTPNLDGLAARGTVFDNAWVANPVCMPNRSSIMTGRLPTAHGVVFNDRSLDWGANTHVRAFRDAGWKTALLGKSHLQHGMSRDSMSPIPSASAVVNNWEPGWDTLEDSERYHQEIPAWPDDFYGFEHVRLTIDHGARISGHHLHWALEKGARFEDIVIPQTAESPSTIRSDRWWQVYQPTYGPELHSTTFVCEETINFIEAATQSDTPWLAWASFPDPHHPFTPPGEWFHRHDPSDMPLSATIDDPLTSAPEYLRRLQQLTAADQRLYVTPFGASDTRLAQECLAANYGTIEFVDHAVGQLLAALDRLGQIDNTIIVFTSDHGDMMGDHGLMLKGFMPFDGNQRVPMVVVDPRRPAGATSAMASSLDLGPTLLDLCGLEGHDGMHGVSLAPAMDDTTERPRDHVLIEDDLPDASAARLRMAAKRRTVVTDDFKFTRFSNGESLLFDRVLDPDEMTDLSDRDPAMLAAAMTTMTDALIAADDTARGTPLATG